MNKIFEIWAVFDHPNEYPQGYAARRFLTNVPTDDFIVSTKLEEVEQALSGKGLVQVDFEEKNPKVVQVWIYGGGLN